MQPPCHVVHTTILSGWEFHAYLLQNRTTTGLTLYEPTDEETVPWVAGVHGFLRMKEAFRVTVRPQRREGVKYHCVPPQVFGTVVLTPTQ